MLRSPRLIGQRYAMMMMMMLVVMMMMMTTMYTLGCKRAAGE
jgi:hypothetical protein